MYLICLAHLFDESLLASNRAAAFLHLVKLNKALADAETAITLNPVWEKVYDFSIAFCFIFLNVSSKRSSSLNLQGYFRKGCVLEAMERYDDVSIWFN